MSDIRVGGGFADRDEAFSVVGRDRRDSLESDQDVVGDGAAAGPGGGEALRTLHERVESLGDATGQEIPRPTRLGGADGADRPAAAAAAGVSEVAARSSTRWGMMAAGVAVTAGLVGMLLWNALGSKKEEVPAPPPTAAAARPPDMMAAPKPALAPVPLQQAMVQQAPQKSPVELLAEKSQRAPLMAATPNGAVQGGPGRAAAATSQEGRAREGLGARDGGFGKSGPTIARVKAYSLGDATFRLSAGTPIPCVLDTAMDTTIAGMVRCHIEHDVLSANQTVVLLDAGTSIVGEYQANLRQGQERIGIVWTRAETPNSVAVDLQSDGADPLGRAGVDGEIETYFWTRFGAAIMFSVITDIGQVARAWAQSQLQQGSNNTNNNSYVFGNVGSSTQQGLNQSMSELIRQAGAIPPVLKKNQGERVYIALRRDLDFSGVYGLERR